MKGFKKLILKVLFVFVLMVGLYGSQTAFGAYTWEDNLEACIDGCSYSYSHCYNLNKLDEYQANNCYLVYLRCQISCYERALN